MFMALAFVVFGANNAQAQRIENKRSTLSVRTMDGAMVRVKESVSANDAVTEIESK